MNRQRLVWWVVVGCAGLAVAASLTLMRRKNSPPLPVVAHYANLPDAFQQTLQGLHDKIRTGGFDPAEVRKLARLYQANRLYPEARACYRVIEARGSGLNARDHYYLADIAQNENDLDGAQTELRLVLGSEPGYLPARLVLAEALFKSGREVEAGKEYSAVLALDAKNPQATLGLARIELQQGQDDAAVARLEGLMASHPESQSGASLLAQVLDRRGDADRAAAMRERSRQKPEPIPADPWKDALLSDCYDVQRLALTFESYYNSGQLDNAMPLLDRIEQLDPKNSTPDFLRAWSQAKAFRHVVAVKKFYEALAKGGDPEKICPLLVQSLLAIDNVTEAVALMVDYTTRLPESVPILTAASDVAIRQGNDQRARILLTKILQKEPYLLAQNMSLAKILWAAGERDAAVINLQRVAKVFPNDVASRALLGEYYLGKSDPFSAIPPLEQARANAPAKTPALDSLETMLGLAYLQAGNGETGQGRFGEAVNYYDQAIRLAPADLRGYGGKANACVHLKQFRPAAEALEKMISLQPENPTIHLSLGDVLYQNGEKEQASRHWQTALQLAAAGDAELRSAINDRLVGRITAETFE